MGNTMTGQPVQISELQNYHDILLPDIFSSVFQTE